MPANICRQAHMIVRLSLFAVLLMAIILTSSAIIRLTQDSCVILSAPGTVITVARIAHRISASSVGIILAFILFLTLRCKPIPGNRKVLLIILVGLTIFLAMLGKFGSGAVVPVITIANIVAGMAMLAFFWRLRIDFVPFQQGVLPSSFRIARIIVLVAMSFLLLQICLGSWIAGLVAGSGCQNIAVTPSVTYWPDALTLKTLDPLRVVNASGNTIFSNALSWLGLVHRLGSLLVLITIIALAVILRQYETSLRSTAVILLIFLVIQMLLGIAMVEWKTVKWIGVVHNIGAAVLLLLTTNIYYRLYRNRPHDVNK